MVVCHCHVVTESEIRNAVRCGARSRASVARACRAGSDCGGCSAAVEEIIAEAHGQSAIDAIGAIGANAATEHTAPTASLVSAMIEETERTLVFPRSGV